MPCLCGGVWALEFKGETGNKATFETLEEAHQNSPAVVGAYQVAAMPGPGAMGPGAAPRPRAYSGHPALDNYPKGTTFVYRSANMYGGRAAARMNTNIIVFAEQHFDSKDAAQAYLKSAGLIDIVDEATGSIVLVTPAGKTFGRADAASYYALQTAMLAQQASGVRTDGTPVFYTDAEYFGGFAYVYVVGVDGGATFFNNHIATTFDFASRIAGALLINGRIDEVRKPSTYIPVHLVNPGAGVAEKVQGRQRRERGEGFRRGRHLLQPGPASPPGHRRQRRRPRRRRQGGLLRHVHQGHARARGPAGGVQRGHSL